MDKYPGLRAELEEADWWTFREVSTVPRLERHIENLLRITGGVNKSNIELNNGGISGGAHRDGSPVSLVGLEFPIPVGGWTEQFRLFQSRLTDVNQFIRDSGKTEYIQKLQNSEEYKRAVALNEVAQVQNLFTHRNIPVQNLWDARIQLEEFIEKHRIPINWEPVDPDPGQKETGGGDAWIIILWSIIGGLVVIAMATATVFYVRIRTSKQRQKNISNDTSETSDLTPQRIIIDQDN
jgi:hypothetical protein